MECWGLLKGINTKAGEKGYSFFSRGGQKKKVRNSWNLNAGLGLKIGEGGSGKSGDNLQMENHNNRYKYNKINSLIRAQ